MAEPCEYPTTRLIRYFCNLSRAAKQLGDDLMSPSTVSSLFREFNDGVFEDAVFDNHSYMILFRMIIL